MRLLTRAFVDYVIEQVKRGPDISGPRNSSLPWWGRWDLNPRPLALFIVRVASAPGSPSNCWTLVSSGRGFSPLDQARRIGMSYCDTRPHLIAWPSCRHFLAVLITFPMSLKKYDGFHGPEAASAGPRFWRSKPEAKSQLRLLIFWFAQ